MAISRFQSRFKTRTDLMDNITPNNVVQMNASVPAGEWKPASWLPVVWQSERSKDFFTISSGKVVSFDASGRIVPSGWIRKAEAISLNDDFLTYTSNDEAARVVDIATGDFVAAGTVYSLLQFCEGVIGRGWMPGAVAPSSDAEAHDFVRRFISAPVGVAAYDVFVWAGDDPANLHFTNYQKQHLIQFFSDVQMRVAHVCEEVGEVAMDPADSLVVSGLARYAGLPNAADVLAIPVGAKYATPTDRTLAVIDGWSGRMRSTPELLARDGDFYVDGDAGMVLFYKAAAADADAPLSSVGVALANTDTITLAAYNAGASAHEQMMHLVGDARPGDFVTFDSHSNFKVRSLSTDLAAFAEADVEAMLTLLHREEEYTVGRVYELQKEPRGLLERVKTGWNGSEFGADAKMPGSATKGFSDLITLSENQIADEIAIINVKMK